MTIIVKAINTSSDSDIRQSILDVRGQLTKTIIKAYLRMKKLEEEVMIWTIMEVVLHSETYVQIY